MENKITPELISKAKQAKTPEELIDIAKINNVELTAEEAKAYFNQLNKTGELNDDELNDVAGGGCHTKDGRLVVTMYHDCDGFICKNCGKGKKFGLYSNSCEGGETLLACEYCKYCTYEKGLWLCNNPKNMK